MRTFSLLKGMDVYDKKGNVLGTVRDICIQNDGIVSHLIVQGKGLLSTKYKVPIEQIVAFGEEEILLKDKKSLEKYSEHAQEFTMHHSQALAKKNAVSQTGEQLGLLDDVYFLEEVGTIIGYELTDGFFSDIKNGKRVIRTQHPPKIRKDAMILTVNNLRGGKTHDEVSELSKQGLGENWD